MYDGISGVCRRWSNFADNVCFNLKEMWITIIIISNFIRDLLLL